MVSSELGQKIGGILGSKPVERDSVLGHSSRISSPGIDIEVTDITPQYQKFDLNRKNSDGKMESSSFAVIGVSDLKTPKELKVEGVIIGTGIGKTIEFFDRKISVLDNPVLTKKYA